jgi:hypothetical protein
MQSEVEALRDRCTQAQPGFLERYNDSLIGWWRTNRSWIDAGKREYLAVHPELYGNGQAMARAAQEVFDKATPDTRQKICTSVTDNLAKLGVHDDHGFNDYMLSLVAQSVKGDCQALRPGFAVSFDANFAAWSARYAGTVAALRQKEMAKYPGQSASQVDAAKRDFLLDSYHRETDPDLREHFCDVVRARLEYLPPARATNSAAPAAQSGPAITGSEETDIKTYETMVRGDALGCAKVLGVSQYDWDVRSNNWYHRFETQVRSGRAALAKKRGMGKEELEEDLYQQAWKEFDAKDAAGKLAMCRQIYDSLAP